MHKHTPHTKGFTLVELSIVLVIIGLIVGGVVGGQALIKSARVGAQVQQLQKFDVAYNNFQLQYDEIPGDMPNAYDYWGVAEGCDDDTTNAGCNGNGDGKISSMADNAINAWRETIKFFIQLSHAKLIPEQYVAYPTDINSAYPELKISPGKGMLTAGWIQDSHGSRHQLSNTAIAKKHIAALYLNISRPADGGNLANDNEGTMSPIQAQKIDKKIDDGVARKGKFQAHRANTQTSPAPYGDCLDGIDGDYLKSNTNTACMGAYILE